MPPRSPRRRQPTTAPDRRERELLTSHVMVKLAPSDRAALERVAEAEDRPLGWIAREAIRDLCSKYPNNETGATS
jgi:hypothetical protein